MDVIILMGVAWIDFMGYLLFFDYMPFAESKVTQ